MTKIDEILKLVATKEDATEFLDIHWEGNFYDYLRMAAENPKIARTAYQRAYDMILSYGKNEYIDNKKKIIRFAFFQDPSLGESDTIYGLDIPLMRLVNILKSAAMNYGTEKRILLLHGPVGSAKSTIVRRLKRGLEKYSRTKDGALYSYSWKVQNDKGETETAPCPMNEEPLHLIPFEKRAVIYKELGLDKAPYPIPVEGELCPFCRYWFTDFMKKYKGDLEKVIQHIVIRRVVFSEKDRVGLASFQPKDEKNQDSTELTGDINYRKIAYYGSDSDPRAFNFDGEFHVANRGLIEFIEVLKLDVAFLYDLLGASQEHKIKPKKFPQTDIDEIIIGHTNEPEYRKLQSNEYMEALRDRTVKIDIPYITRWSEEIKIYKKDFNPQKIKNIHIAPHTLEVASMWAVITRLEPPKKHDLDILNKLKLYDGKMLSGYTEDTVIELRKETKHEAMEGISPRYIQDKISSALVSERLAGCLNPFMVLNELEAGLKHHSLITSDEQRTHFAEMLSLIRQEYEDLAKYDVQRAITADEEAIGNLCSNYIDNVKAYTQKEKVKNRFTGRYEEPDERLMRSIEEKIGIDEARKDDFRREIMNYIGALAVEGKNFDYRTNERLRKALELKLFEDQKDTIKLTSLVTAVVDKETQEKIDIVKSRLINNYGYCEICSTDALNFVASIYARGDVKE
ncbi:MAG: serine protein kinase [Myxococcota bacterium]